MQFKIENNIPVGQIRKNLKYPFDKMAVGTSFRYPKKLQRTVSGSAIAYGRKNKMKFTTRTNGTYGRIWRVK